MNEGVDTIRISLRLADGRFFPLFRYGHPDRCSLLLVPVQEDQNEINLQFFHHPIDGTTPLCLGTLRFSDLPERGDTELRLDANIGTADNLLVEVRHKGSGRVKKLEMKIPPERHATKSNGLRGHIWRKDGLYWIFGILFLLVCLGLMAWGVFFIVDMQRPAFRPAPVSMMHFDKPAIALTLVRR